MYSKYEGYTYRVAQLQLLKLEEADPPLCTFA